MREDLSAAGLPTTYAECPIDFNATRRSFGTWLRKNHVNDAVRKRLMGHSVTDVTDKHYTDVELSDLAEAIESISLNLATAQVVALPLQRGANDDAPSPSDSLEPPRGLEPRTYGLRNRCSTTELGRPTVGYCFFLPFTPPLPARAKAAGPDPMGA
jgi:hypothetical protein